MIRWFVRTLRLEPLASRRRRDLDDRATVLALFARFTDELASGLLVVLMPNLRRRLGLTLAQVGWLWQVVFSVAAIVEPVAGAAVDVVRRRPLLVLGALGWGAALLLIAGAPSFGWALAAFALIGVTSGPLANTADVVLVEGHPDEVERIAGRSTVLDTVGALLAPAAVVLAGWWGISERTLLVVCGGAAVGYALLLATSVFPPPSGREIGTTIRTHLRTNAGAVLRDVGARRWLVALLVNETLDVPELFEPVWLRDEVGTSSTLVAVHVGIGLGATLLTLVVLDRLLARFGSLRVLLGSCLATLVTYPAWLLVPGIAAKLVLVVPRNAAMAPLWPILRSRSLAAVPGAGGTTSALYSLLGLVPLQAAFGFAAGRVGMAPMFLTVTIGGTLVLLLLVRRLSRTPAAERTPDTPAPPDTLDPPPDGTDLAQPEE